MIQEQWRLPRTRVGSCQWVCIWTAGAQRQSEKVCGKEVVMGSFVLISWKMEVGDFWIGECAFQMESICHLQFLSVWNANVPILSFSWESRKGQVGLWQCTLQLLQVATWQIELLSCQQQRGENNNKDFLTLEENYRKKAAEKDLQGQ